MTRAVAARLDRAACQMVSGLDLLFLDNPFPALVEIGHQTVFHRVDPGYDRGVGGISDRGEDSDNLGGMGSGFHQSAQIRDFQIEAFLVPDKAPAAARQWKS